MAGTTGGYLNVVIQSNEYLMDGYPCSASQQFQDVLLSLSLSLPLSLSLFSCLEQFTERQREREMGYGKFLRYIRAKFPRGKRLSLPSYLASLLVLLLLPRVSMNIRYSFTKDSAPFRLKISRCLLSRQFIVRCLPYPVRSKNSDTREKFSVTFLQRL